MHARPTPRSRYHRWVLSFVVALVAALGAAGYSWSHQSSPSASPVVISHMVPSVTLSGTSAVASRVRLSVADLENENSAQTVVRVVNASPGAFSGIDIGLVSPVTGIEIDVNSATSVVASGHTVDITVKVRSTVPSPFAPDEIVLAIAPRQTPLDLATK